MSWGSSRFALDFCLMCSTVWQEEPVLGQPTLATERRPWGSDCTVAAARVAHRRKVAVDPQRFDTIVKSLSRSGTRRGLVRVLAALPLGVAGSVPARRDRSA